MDDGRAVKTGAAVAASVVDLCGRTPMVRLHRMPRPGSAEVLAKLEMFSPGGSVKDRIASHMVKCAEERGLLDADTVIIEPTSGNTGIGLAMVCAARGYRCIVVMPDSMSLERIALLKRFGAEVVLTPAREDMAGAVRKANELAKKHTKAFVPFQFENDWNPEMHRLTTGPEILEAAGSGIDAFVAGVGTGGTITGVGEVLRSACPGIRIVAVEPAGSPVLSRGTPGHHKIQGIGAGFVPKVLNRAILDEVRVVTDAVAYATMQELAAREGILGGMSAGAAVRIALDVAAELGAGRRVVVMVPDTGERYLTVQHYFEL
jgi:cysteine synthase A